MNETSQVTYWDRYFWVGESINKADLALTKTKFSDEEQYFYYNFTVD